VSWYQKGKTNLDFTKARDSEWQWHQLGRMQVCISLQTDNHTSTPGLSFLQARCPSYHPTNSVRALKAQRYPGYIFLNSRRFLCDKPYNISDPVYCRTSYFLSFSRYFPAGTLTTEIIVILFTQGLPYVQCTKNHLTCEDYIANYKIFQEHQLNSRRFLGFPGVVNTLNKKLCYRR